MGKEDGLVDLATVSNWNAQDVRAWLCTVVTKDDRAKILTFDMDGRAFLSWDYLTLSLVSRNAVSQKMRKWRADAEKNQPLLSWVKPDSQRPVWLHSILVNGVLAAMDEMGPQQMVWGFCDPPIGDGQCQCRAATNSMTLHRLQTEPGMQAKWSNLYAELQRQATTSTIVPELTALFQDHSWMLDPDLAAIWHLIKCHVLTRGKECSPPPKINSDSSIMSMLMSTNKTVLGEQLRLLNANVVDHLVFMLRDQISKESVRFLRRHIRSAKMTTVSVLTWWSVEKATELYGPKWTQTVRGGWPSVPMFWSYASLFRLLWDTVPIVLRIQTADTAHFVVHLNRHSVQSASAWIIDGFSSSPIQDLKSLSVGDWVERVMMSVADHPQYPVESNSAEYRKIKDTGDRKQLEEELPLARKRSGLSEDELLEEVFRARMITEQPEHNKTLHPYGKYRDEAHANGCTSHNPKTLVVQHVYPHAAFIALADPFHHCHIPAPILAIIHQLL